MLWVMVTMIKVRLCSVLTSYVIETLLRSTNFVFSGTLSADEWEAAYLIPLFCLEKGLSPI